MLNAVKIYATRYIIRYTLLYYTLSAAILYAGRQ
jgi:hypothetical protein